MADYQDFETQPDWGPREIYQRITDLLLGAYSVEVIPSGQTVKLRVWFEQHCDPAMHNRIE